MEAILDVDASVVFKNSGNVALCLISDNFDEAAFLNKLHEWLEDGNDLQTLFPAANPPAPNRAASEE